MPSEEEHTLIGSWRVVEFADLDKDGECVSRFGEHPRGYFVYDATGHVHIQIMKVPPLPRFPEANVSDGKPPTAEHALAAYNAYVAYFGTYTVDTRKHIVTQHVEGSLAPDFTFPESRLSLGGRYTSACSAISSALEILMPRCP